MKLRRTSLVYFPFVFPWHCPLTRNVFAFITAEYIQRRRRLEVCVSCQVKNFLDKPRFSSISKRHSHIGGGGCEGLFTESIKRHRFKSKAFRNYRAALKPAPPTLLSVLFGLFKKFAAVKIISWPFLSKWL